MILLYATHSKKPARNTRKPMICVFCHHVDSFTFRLSGLIWSNQQGKLHCFIEGNDWGNI